MKKIVRNVWIGALSGLAFLAACCSSKGLSKAEKKELIRERDSIQEILSKREGSCIYGTPEVMERYKNETKRLQYQLDSINARLSGDVDFEKNARRQALQERIDELQTALKQREGACIYGSPEVMQRYGEKTREMQEELEEAQRQLQELDQ